MTCPVAPERTIADGDCQVGALHRQWQGVIPLTTLAYYVLLSDAS